MQFWEANAYMEGLKNRRRSAWETTRTLGFWMLKAWGSKINSPSELMPLDIDKAAEEDMPTDEEIEELRQMLQEERQRTRQ